MAHKGASHHGRMTPPSPRVPGRITITRLHGREVRRRAAPRLPTRADGKRYRVPPRPVTKIRTNWLCPCSGSPPHVRRSSQRSAVPGSGNHDCPHWLTAGVVVADDGARRGGPTSSQAGNPSMSVHASAAKNQVSGSPVRDNDESGSPAYAHDHAWLVACWQAGRGGRPSRQNPHLPHPQCLQQGLDEQHWSREKPSLYSRPALAALGFSRSSPILNPSHGQDTSQARNGSDRTHSPEPHALIPRPGRASRCLSRFGRQATFPCLPRPVSRALAVVE